MSNDTSGPAFPCLPPLGPDGTAAAGYPYVCGGMTLRDYFAAKAMQMFVEDLDPSQAANMSYMYADAMIKAREA